MQKLRLLQYNQQTTFASSGWRSVHAVGRWSLSVCSLSLQKVNPYLGRRRGCVLGGD